MSTSSIILIAVYAFFIILTIARKIVTKATGDKRKGEAVEESVLTFVFYAIRVCVVIGILFAIGFFIKHHFFN